MELASCPPKSMSCFLLQLPWGLPLCPHLTQHLCCGWRASRVLCFGCLKLRPPRVLALGNRFLRVHLRALVWVTSTGGCKGSWGRTRSCWSPGKRPSIRNSSQIEIQKVSFGCVNVLLLAEFLYRRSDVFTLLLPQLSCCNRRVLRMLSRELPAKTQAVSRTWLPKPAAGTSSALPAACGCQLSASSSVQDPFFKC